MMIDGINITSLRRNGELVWTEESGKEYPHEWAIVKARVKSVEPEVKEIPFAPVAESVSTTIVSLPEGRSKKEQAIAIFNSNRSMSRGECIERFMKELNMTKAGASTYYANCKKV